MTRTRIPHRPGLLGRPGPGRDWAGTGAGSGPGPGPGVGRDRGRDWAGTEPVTCAFSQLDRIPLVVGR
jgi:hypothetical protein